MMMKQEHHAEIASELARHGIKAEVEPTRGGHLRYRWKANGHSQCLTVAKTPSDWRGQKNNIARIKRMMRDAGVVPTDYSLRAVTSKPTLTQPAARESLDDRIARLEADVRMLLDLITHPTTASPAAPLVPEQPDEAPKRRGKRADYAWLWRVMRYDEYLPYTKIAALTGRKPTTISVKLNYLKNKGLVAHKRGEGWRKTIQVEYLDRPQMAANGSANGQHA